jgi:Domain of unknown function (DU1801)
MTPLENFYDLQPEPNKSCLLALKDIILSQDENIAAAWKYGLPFFCYKSKMFCYLWVHKKLQQPYIGIEEGKHFDEPYLMIEKASRMKKLFIDPNEDIPIEIVTQVIQKAINLNKDGVVKIK